MTHTVRRHRWIVLTLVAAAGLAALVAVNSARVQAQEGGRPAGSTYTGQAFTFTEVVPGVYHAVGTGALAVGCNASVIVNADDVHYPWREDYYYRRDGATYVLLPPLR